MRSLSSTLLFLALAQLAGPAWSQVVREPAQCARPGSAGFLPGAGGCNGPGFQVVSPSDRRHQVTISRRLLEALPPRCIRNADDVRRDLEQCGAAGQRCVVVSAVEISADAECAALAAKVHRQVPVPAPLPEPLPVPLPVLLDPEGGQDGQRP